MDEGFLGAITDEPDENGGPDGEARAEFDRAQVDLARRASGLDPA